MISSQQLTILRNKLEEEKQKLKSTIRHTKEKQTTGELSSYDNHPADMGSELYEKESDLAINDHVEEELKKIEEAIQAMKEETYGNCKECGNSIPFERLEAIPTTLYCIDHTKQSTAHQYRPIEEEVLTPSFNNDKRSNEIKDHEDSFAEVARYGTSDTPADYTGDEENYQDQVENENFTEDFNKDIGNDIKGKQTIVFHNKK